MQVATPYSQLRKKLRWPREAGYVAVTSIFTIAFFWLWPTNIVADDAGITLKYMDHFAEGYFYTYNPSDGPVFGISSFLHGILAGLFAYTHLLSPLNSLFASNAIHLCYKLWLRAAHIVPFAQILLSYFRPEYGMLSWTQHHRRPCKHSSRAVCTLHVQPHNLTPFAVMRARSSSGPGGNLQSRPA